MLSEGLVTLASMKKEAVRLSAELGKCFQSTGVRRKTGHLIRQRLNQREQRRNRMQ